MNVEPVCKNANVGLMRKVLDQIESDPAHWRQRRWVEETDCGTAYCFAGWALHFTGHELVPLQYNAPVAYVTTLDGREERVSQLFVLDGQLVDEEAIDALAQKELGIGDADWGDPRLNLFWGYNDLDTVREIAERLAGERL